MIGSSTSWRCSSTFCSRHRSRRGSSGINLESASSQCVAVSHACQVGGSLSHVLLAQWTERCTKQSQLHYGARLARKPRRTSSDMRHLFYHSSSVWSDDQRGECVYNRVFIDK